MADAAACHRRPRRGALRAAGGGRGDQGAQEGEDQPRTAAMVRGSCCGHEGVLGQGASVSCVRTLSQPGPGRPQAVPPGTSGRGSPAATAAARRWHTDPHAATGAGTAQGAPAPALHRVDAALRTLLELAARARHPAARRADRASGRRSCARTDERGWFRFQRLYDVARSVLRDRGRRAPAGARGGRGRRRGRLAAGWRSRSTRPAYAARFGGHHRVHRARARRRPGRLARPPGSGSRVVIAANRTRHPLDARTLARLAVQYAGRRAWSASGCPTTSAAGAPRDFAPAFAIARAGRAAAWPRTAASCSAPASVAATASTTLHAGPARPRRPRPPRTPRCWSGWSRRGRRRSRSARSPTSRSGSTPT